MHGADPRRAAAWTKEKEGCDKWMETYAAPRDPAGKPSCGLCCSYRTGSPQTLTHLGCTGLSLQVRHTTLIGSEGGRGSVLTHESPEWGFRAIFHCTGCADSSVTGVSWHCLQVTLQKLL